MSETKILRVEQRHIDGAGHGAKNCPLARAARDLFPEFGQASVIPGNIHLYNEGHYREGELWDISEDGTAAITRYDRFLGMEPGEYTITRTEPYEA